MRQHVGEENIFIFGLLAEEVRPAGRAGLDATAATRGVAGAVAALEDLASGVYSPGRRVALPVARERPAPL